MSIIKPVEVKSVITKSNLPVFEELLVNAALNERDIIKKFLSIKNGETVELVQMSEALFAWAKQWISENG